MDFSPFCEIESHAQEVVNFTAVNLHWLISAISCLSPLCKFIVYVCVNVAAQHVIHMEVNSITRFNLVSLPGFLEDFCSIFP